MIIDYGVTRCGIGEKDGFGEKRDQGEWGQAREIDILYVLFGIFSLDKPGECLSGTGAKWLAILSGVNYFA